MKNSFFFLLFPAAYTELAREVSQTNKTTVHIHNAMPRHDSDNRAEHALWSLSSFEVHPLFYLHQIMSTLSP